MSKHYTIPSFAARSQSNADTYTLKYNPDTKKYSLTLEDTNNTLSDIKFSVSGISVTRSGNKYTFTSDKMITSPVTVSAQKMSISIAEKCLSGAVLVNRQWFLELPTPYISILKSTQKPTAQGRLKDL